MEQLNLEWSNKVGLKMTLTCLNMCLFVSFPKISFPNGFVSKSLIQKRFGSFACVAPSFQAPSEEFFPRIIVSLARCSVHCFSGGICIPVKVLSVHTSGGINSVSTLVPAEQTLDTDMHTEMCVVQRHNMVNFYCGLETTVSYSKITVDFHLICCHYLLKPM